MGEGEGHGVAERVIQIFGNRPWRSSLHRSPIKIDSAKWPKWRSSTRCG